MSAYKPRRSRARTGVQTLQFAGYVFDAGPTGTVIRRGSVDTTRPGDYGADPLGDGTFRMVPSGDVVSWEERCKRLHNR